MTTIDDMNYARDPRNCTPATAPVLYLNDGTEAELPTEWVVCEVCSGEGKHVNPSIDCGGISAEEFRDDPEFADSYMRGDYDQVCNACQGRTTVQGVAWDQLTKEQREHYEYQLRDEAADRAEHLDELRMGA